MIEIADITAVSDLKILSLIFSACTPLNERISCLSCSEKSPSGPIMIQIGSSENFVYIDTFTADVVNRSDPMMSGTRMMSGKYRMVGLDHTDWGKYFKFNRNTEKENELYYDVLGLKDDSKYAYVNDIVTTDIVKTGKFSGREFDYPVVNNQIIDGYSLFDWVKVWENAKEIHTQCSGLCFIIDVIDTKGKVFYYPHDERQYKDLIDSLNNVYEWKLEF